MKNLLQFTLNENGSQVTWSAPGTPMATTEGADFWRLMADDGYYKEMSIKSSEQTTGKVTVAGNVTTVVYNGLVSAEGRHFDTTLTLTITESEDGYRFGARIENRDDARMNELEYPYVDLACLCNIDRKKDVLVRPNYLGERVEDPWTSLAKSNTEYMSADYLDVKSTILYPRPASMAWQGIESAGHFLYIGRHDPRCRICCVMNAVNPRTKTEPRLAGTICHYPFVRNGETVETPIVMVALAKGDWRVGSDLYGAFARSTYYKPHTPPEWVRQMRGWQRVILRHQYGEIFWKYEDLPRLYLEGKKSGLDTLMVFGWWKGRFDNNYPHYEVDEELGGEEGLRAAIAEVQCLGGNVILYNNGILIDKKSEFYRECGSRVARIDIDGNEYEDHYKFENNGTVLRNFGYKSFVDACQATEEWPAKMIENAKLKLSFSPNAIFFDQVGGRNKLCFNPAHKHGYRPDDEPVYRMENLRRYSELLGKDQALGTECTNDGICYLPDFIHGCDKGNYYRRNLQEPVRGIFPAMFRRTFPEPVMTNRFLHDCRKGWEDELNFAFINGHRFDVSIYRGRKIGIAGLPEYAAHVGYLNEIKAKYADFFFGDGLFVCDTDLTDLPKGVRYGEFKCGTRHLLAFMNASDEAVSIPVGEHVVKVEAHKVACLEI